MADTPTVINVGSFTDLNYAILAIDSGTLPNGQPVNENDVEIKFTNSIDATAGNYETVFNTPGDLLALDNPLANVTIEGNGFTYNGGGEVRGFMVLDGNVTIDNLVVAGTVVVVAHGVVIRVLLTTLLDGHGSEDFSAFAIDNAAVNDLRWDGTRWSAVALNRRPDGDRDTFAW